MHQGKVILTISHIYLAMHSSKNVGSSYRVNSYGSHRASYKTLIV